MAARVCKTLCLLSSRRITVTSRRSWSILGLRSGSRSFSQSRSVCAEESKDVKVTESESAKSVGETKQGSPGPTAPMDFTPYKNPTTFDRFLLAWANIYPSMEEVPNRVKMTQMMHARDICRVKVAHWMTGILVVLIAIQIFSGRKEREARIAAYEEENEQEYQEQLRQRAEREAKKGV